MTLEIIHVQMICISDTCIIDMITLHSMWFMNWFVIIRLSKYLVDSVHYKVKVNPFSMNLFYGSRWVWSLVCLSSRLVDHSTGGYDSYGDDCDILVYDFGTGLCSLDCSP